MTDLWPLACAGSATASAAAAAVGAGVADALKRRVSPPSTVDIIELFLISQSVPTNQPTRAREKERERERREKETKEKNLFIFKYLFLKSDPVHTPRPLCRAEGVPVGVACLPSFGTPILQMGP
jgi:hypothetical protein